MTLRELSEVLYQNVTFNNELLEVRKVILEDGVLEVIFWEPAEDFIWSELDFNIEEDIREKD